jgi:hypothetical protein
MAGAHHLIDLGWYAREILKHLIEVGSLMDGNQRLKNGTRTCVMNVRRKVSPAERALVVRRGTAMSSPSPRFPGGMGASSLLGGFTGAPTSFRYARSLPLKAGLVSDAPASSVVVKARAFALLPERVK